MNLICMTNYMTNLIYGKIGNVEKYKDVIKLFDWFQYKEAKDIVKLNNKHINNAIKEVLQNERFVKILNEETDINVEEITQTLQHSH